MIIIDWKNIFTLSFNIIFQSPTSPFEKDLVPVINESESFALQKSPTMQLKIDDSLSSILKNNMSYNVNSPIKDQSLSSSVVSSPKGDLQLSFTDPIFDHLRGLGITEAENCAKCKLPITTSVS